MGYKVLCPSVALLAYLMICQHVRAHCTQPSFPSRNVILTANHLSTQSFPDGSTVTFECVIGYRAVDSKASKTVNCQGTQWTSLDLSCTRKSCGTLADIVHGRYEMSGNLFGDTAKPVCDTGYMLAGIETTRTCRDQGWDGRDPVCEPVTCSAPPAIENGQLQDEPLESYVYSQAVTYKCNEGLNIIGQSTLRCSEDGTFKPDPPKCFDGCPAPTIPNAKRIGGRSPPYKLGHFLEYKCEDDYIMKGEAYIVCRPNGWDPEPPRCIATTTTTTARPTTKAHPKDNETDQEGGEGSNKLAWILGSIAAIVWNSNMAAQTLPEASPPDGSLERNEQSSNSSISCVGGGVGCVLCAKKKCSKHQYSDKVETNNQEDCL